MTTSSQLIDLIFDLFLLAYRHFSKGPMKCKHCKIPLEPFAERQLFLLPVFHDDTYNASVPYYLENLTPIDTLLDIPTGRRSCYLDYLVCPKCGKKIVSIIDFLYVREKMITFDANIYDYELFQSFKEDLT